MKYKAAPNTITMPNRKQRKTARNQVWYYNYKLADNARKAKRAAKREAQENG